MSWPAAWGKKQLTINTGSLNRCAGPGAESFLRTLTSIQRFMKSGMNGKKNSWTLPPERRHRKALTADESLRRGHARAFVVSHKLATTEMVSGLSNVLDANHSEGSAVSRCD